MGPVTASRAGVAVSNYEQGGAFCLLQGDAVAAVRLEDT